MSALEDLQNRNNLNDNLVSENARLVKENKRQAGQIKFLQNENQKKRAEHVGEIINDPIILLEYALQELKKEDLVETERLVDWAIETLILGNAERFRKGYRESIKKQL